MAMVEHDEENTEVPVRIGSGSFATVFTAAGSSFAVKICHSAEDTQVDDLLKEFECLKDIFQHCQPAYFKAPRPLAYFNPTAADFKFCEEPPSVINSIRIPAIRPSVDLFDIYGIETAGYAMQRVHPVPLAASRFIKKAFLPEGYQNDASVHLCRLYFGKILKPSRFVNLTNFQLDRDRYLKLQQALSQAYLPDPEELCFEMGYTLGVIHWDCRYDGRDIEFVLGGDGVSGLRFHVLDFNQMRKRNTNVYEVSELVDAFFQNDPYFPRPKDGGQLYRQFRDGYLFAHPKTDDSRIVAKNFLREIEARDGVFL